MSLLALSLCTSVSQGGGGRVDTTHFKREAKKGTFQLMRSVKIICQKSICLSGFVFWHLSTVFLLANKTWATDPDLYRFVSVGLFSQHITIFVMLIFVFILVTFFFFLKRNKFCQTIHQNATKSDHVVLPNRMWLVQWNRMFLYQVE